jgi:ADP-heptose:LPS heptosyltransferase
VSRARSSRARPGGGALRRLRTRLNRRLYRLLFRAYHAAFPSSAPPGPARPADVRRVLVVRHDRIGDMIVTTPLLAWLREALPHAELDVLASPANAPLVAHDPRVTRVIVNDHTWRGWLRAWRALRARRYDLVLSAIGRAHLREGLVASLVAPRRARRATAARPAQYRGLFTHWVRVSPSWRQTAARLLWVARRVVDAPPSMAVASACEALARWPLRLAEDAAAEARACAFVAERGLAGVPFAAVNAWASEPWREMGVERCAELLRLVAARSPELALVLTPPPGRGEEAARIAAAAGAGVPVVVFPPSTRVHDLVSLVRRAAVVVTPDTANVHVASACGRPVVGLYSARTTDPAAWAPVGVPYRALLAPPGAPVSAIPSGDVADAVAALVAPALHAAGPAPAG